MIKDIKYGACVCVIQKDKVLLVRQAKGERHSQLWGPPGGRREKNETFIEIAKRELFEETGLQNLPLLLYHLAIWDDDEKSTIVAMYKSYCKGEAEPVVHATDVSELAWVSKQDIHNDKYPLRDISFKTIILHAFNNSCNNEDLIQFYKRKSNK